MAVTAFLEQGGDGLGFLVLGFGFREVNLGVIRTTGRFMGFRV